MLGLRTIIIRIYERTMYNKPYHKINASERYIKEFMKSLAFSKKGLSFYPVFTAWLTLDFC